MTTSGRYKRALAVLGSTAIGVLAVLALVAAPAAASCGGVNRSVPKGHIDPGHRPPLAIGDSTMLLAVGPLAAVGFEVNARGCRPMWEGLDLLDRLRRERRLPKLVLMNLGANSGMSSSEIRQALEILGPKRILVMVTPRQRDAGVIRAAAKRWPKRLRVLDWVSAYAGHPGWFSGDGLHLSWSGVDAFVALSKRFVALNN